MCISRKIEMSNWVDIFRFYDCLATEEHHDAIQTPPVSETKRNERALDPFLISRSQGFAIFIREIGVVNGMEKE